ncbi:MAG TPA: protein phosphatase 2C domain-containing protein [Kofleriaceae bacterium]|nr:protein phosphatase 2C domain-containing protein [Kofleriaceae bacterium]
MSGKSAPRAHGVTHPGNVRRKNEDCFLADAELGLYLVLDGMGGHNAGHVASARARDVIRAEVRANLGRKPPAALLEGAVRAASAAVFAEAQRERDLTGMGTTVVACFMAGERRVILAHVGDSRVYALQRGRMRLLTRDHTVVAELLARGALNASEAAVHPYKSVLSRNLGGRSDARVDMGDLELEPGDRLLLCSDGLSGFASHEAMEQVLGGAEDPDRAAAELVELALRGGGGDNVTALVIELGAEPARDSTQEQRRSAAAAWWARRELFQTEARRRRVHQSPICAVLSPEEAVAIVAGNLCEAVYHDLEQAAGLHVWTYAENLANGWLDQAGEYAALRDLLDQLREAALVVVADVAEADPRLAVGLETGLLRALIVAEMAVAGALGERMRKLEAVLVTQHTRATTAPAFSDEKTVELTGAYKVEPPSPMVVACLERAWAACREQRDARHPQSAQVVEAAHRAALDTSAEVDMAPAMRELFGTRVLSEGALHPLLEALGRGRARHMQAVRDLAEAPSIRLAALRRLSMVHAGMMSALAVLVFEAAQEVSERYRRATLVSARMRGEMTRQEVRISTLERQLATAAGELEAGAGFASASGSAAFAAASDDAGHAAIDLGLATVPDGRPEPDPTRPGEGGKP